LLLLGHQLYLVNRHDFTFYLHEGSPMVVVDSLYSEIGNSIWNIDTVELLELMVYVF
jgi:hypothetical protein